MDTGARHYTVSAELCVLYPVCQLFKNIAIYFHIFIFISRAMYSHFAFTSEIYVCVYLNANKNGDCGG